MTSQPLSQYNKPTLSCRLPKTGIITTPSRGRHHFVSTKGYRFEAWSSPTCRRLLAYTSATSTSSRVRNIARDLLEPTFSVHRVIIRLLRLLLRSRSTQILSHIGGIDNLTTKTLHSVPTLSGRRWEVGVLNLLVNVGRSTRESALNKLTLVESCSQEDSVDGQRRISSAATSIIELS